MRGLYIQLIEHCTGLAFYCDLWRGQNKFQSLARLGDWTFRAHSPLVKPIAAAFLMQYMNSMSIFMTL